MPIEETAATLASFQREGKIRAIGVSNFTPEQMDRFRTAAPLSTVQPPIISSKETSSATSCLMPRLNDLTVLAYGALCRGF